MEYFEGDGVFDGGSADCIWRNGEFGENNELGHGEDI